LYRRAVEVFDDDAESAQQFLTESQPGLNGLIPAEVARSEYGASEVMDLLGRIDYGVHT
jgi:putative toxin-antitoxin system antitoxin component (TIGR02293 family)